MWSLHRFLHGIQWIMFHGHLDYFSKPPLGGTSNTKPRRPWHPKHFQMLIYSILSCVKTHVNKNSLKWYLVEGPVTCDFTLHLRVPWPHYMRLEASWDGLWTLSCGLSQFHGHGSWLVCEVALSVHVMRLVFTETYAGQGLSYFHT
jgi:hypothetical protein